MNLRVTSIMQKVEDDINSESSFDVKHLDAVVAMCLAASSDSIMKVWPTGYSEFECAYLINIVDGLKSSHASIRLLLANGLEASSVDALVIARLQLESLYNFCYLQESPANLQLFLKNGWKKQYIRFLLGREERKHLARASNFYLHSGPEALEQLRLHSYVSEAEKAWIEFEELGFPTAPPAAIPKFPTPMGVLQKLSGPRLAMLKRLYPEYQFLCSFAHGANEAALFRTVTNPRSPTRHFIEKWKSEDLWQRQIAEPAITYSALSCLCIGTEIYAANPSDFELAGVLTNAWNLLADVSLLGKAIWSIRAKAALGAL